MGNYTRGRSAKAGQEKGEWSGKGVEREVFKRIKGSGSLGREKIGERKQRKRKTENAGKGNPDCSRGGRRENRKVRKESFSERVEGAGAGRGKRGKRPKRGGSCVEKKNLTNNNGEKKR